MKWLLENGAPVNFRDDTQGTTALYWAVKGESIDSIRMLLNHGAQVRLPRTEHKNLLHVAVKTGKVEIVNLLCEHGGDVNEPRDRFGETPLFRAVRANNFEMVGRLIELGSSVNSFSNDFLTPLHLAAGNVHKNIDILQLLLDNGALVNCKDCRGHIPFVTCLRTSIGDILYKGATQSICECLVRHGSLVNDEHSHDVLEWQATHLACYSLVKLCVAAGLDLYKGRWSSLFARDSSSQNDTAGYVSASEREDMENFIQFHLRNPRLLADSCRITIRTYLSGIYEGASIYYHIQKLPLPESMVLFLLLEE